LNDKIQGKDNGGNGEIQSIVERQFSPFDASPTEKGKGKRGSEV